MMMYRNKQLVTHKWLLLIAYGVFFVTTSMIRKNDPNDRLFFSFLFVSAGIQNLNIVLDPSSTTNMNNIEYITGVAATNTIQNI